MKKIVTLIALHFALLTFGQSGSLDTSFNPTDIGFDSCVGLNGGVFATSIQSDGKIIIGGNLASYNDTEIKKITRLNTDGSLDKDFNCGSGPNNTVRSTCLQSDGKIIIAGDFTTFNGVTVNRIARLNSDGSLDSTFKPGQGANNSIYSVSVQSSGQIIIVGSFTSYKGVSRDKVARLNADGGLDTSFTPWPTTPNVNFTVSKIYSSSVQSDGKIIIGGQFSVYFTVPKKYGFINVARLNVDGSLDTSFDVGTGTTSSVTSTNVQSDGKIIIAGDFTNYNGTAQNYITRLNTDGSLDANFHSGATGGVKITAASVQSDGKIMIIGDLGYYDLKPVQSIARLNSDGTLDTSFNSGTGTLYSIVAASTQTDGKIIIGGGFRSYNGILRNNLTRLNSDGSLDFSFNPNTGANDDIRTSSLQSDGKIIIGGDFKSYNGISKEAIARLNSDGSLDMNFNTGAVDGSVFACPLQPDGKILIGGQFDSYNGIPRKCIARLKADGTLDTSFDPGGGIMGGAVQTILLQPDGKIIIGGNFYNYNGTGINSIARLNSDGSLDTSFNSGTGPGGRVSISLIQSDGKIIIGGDFTSYNGVTVNKIARLNADGSLDTSFNANLRPNDYVSSVCLQPNGKIIIGGYFENSEGIVTKVITRLNSDGTVDTGFVQGASLDASSSISCVSLQSDGKIVITGNIDGEWANYIARLNSDGSLDTSFESGIGANNWIETTLIQPDGKIIIGGNFTSVNGTGRNRVTRLNGNISLGINNSIAKSIQLYPNPVSDTLTIETQEEVVPQVEIYDILGKSVKALTSFDKRVDVSSLPSGVYIINVTDGNQRVYRSKFVKK